MKGAETSMLSSLMPEEGALHVVRNLGPAKMTWEEIFDSKIYDELYAVTYVASPRFLSNLLSGFKKSRIIVGIDNAKALQPIDDLFRGGNVRLFNKLAEDVRDKVCTGQVSFRYPSSTEPVHSKLFLMRASGGRTRMVVGSINLTENALTERGKHQYEEAFVLDDSPAFEPYLRRYEAIDAKCFDYIPEIAKRSWAEDGILIDLHDPEIMKAVILEGLEGETGKRRAFAALEPDYKELCERCSRDDPEVSREDATQLEVMRKLKVNGDGRFALKSGTSLANAVAKIQEKVLTVEAEEPSESTMPFLAAADDGDALRFYYAKTRDDGSTIQMLDPFFCEPLERDEIDAALANIEAFIDTYAEYTVNEIDADYGKWIYEAVLYTLAAPVVETVRSYASDAYGENTLADIPLYLVIGGRAGSGKTHLLEYLFQLLSGECLSVTSCQFKKMSSADLYGSNLKKAFKTGNRFPLFVDEVKPSFFKGAAAEDLKANVNGLKNCEYSPIIGTTNAEDYMPSEGAVRRLKYLPLNEVFDKSNLEGEAAFQAILAQTTNALAKDFLVRFGDAVGDGRAPYGDQRDYLVLAREIMLDYYRACERDVPESFPHYLIDNSTIEGKNRWLQLWNDPTYRDCFVPIEDEKKLRVEVERLFPNKPTNRERNEYVAGLPPIVAFSKNAKYVELNTVQFFDWIGVKSPYEKKSFAQRLKSMFS